jgi:hypothetical protein
MVQLDYKIARPLSCKSSVLRGTQQLEVLGAVVPAAAVAVVHMLVRAQVPSHDGLHHHPVLVDVSPIRRVWMIGNVDEDVSLRAIQESTPATTPAGSLCTDRLSSLRPRTRST